MSKLVLHKIPNIDKVHRDPILESYHNYDTQNQDLENENENEKEDNEENNDEIDINQTNFLEYSPEQLDNLNAEVIKEEIVILNKDINGEKPNFNILEELQKRVFDN